MQTETSQAEMSVGALQDEFKQVMLTTKSQLDSVLSDRFSSVFESDDIALTTRLDVYRNNILVSLSNVLLDCFEATEKLVGREFFNGMARVFISQYPPIEGCLNQYGADLPKFLEAFPPVRELPYLADVARLEVALNDAYYAPEDLVLTAQCLSLVSEDLLADLSIQLRDSVTLLRSAYPVLELRAFALTGENPPQNLDGSSGQEHFTLVFRPELDVEMLALEQCEFAFLTALLDKRLGEAVEAVLESYPAFDIQATLEKHLNLGTFKQNNQGKQNNLGAQQ